MSIVPFSASEIPVPEPGPRRLDGVLGYFVLYPPAHRLKSG